MIKKRKVALNKGDLSTRRRKKKKFKSTFLAFLVLVAVVGSVFILRLQFLQIKKVAAENEAIRQVAQKEISGNYLGIFQKSNVLFYPKSAVEDAIEQNFPELSSLKVRASFVDQTLYIETREKVAVALWCDGACYNMDYSGVVFAAANGNAEGFIKYRGLINGNPINKKFGQNFSEIAAFAKEVGNLGFSVESVKIIDDESGEVFLREGFVIKFLLAEIEGEDLSENIKIFIDNMKAKNGGSLPNFEYIDARYGNKIFYK